MKAISVKVNYENIDEYIEHVKMYNYWYAKRHESEKYLKKAMEQHQKMNQILWNLGFNVLLTLERLTGKSIPIPGL